MLGSSALSELGQTQWRLRMEESPWWQCVPAKEVFTLRSSTVRRGLVPLQQGRRCFLSPLPPVIFREVEAAPLLSDHFIVQIVRTTRRLRRKSILKESK